MSKERLEEVKTRFNAMKELESFKKLAPTDLFFDDLNWLLQQAERVQELERQNKALGLEVNGWFNKANEIHESMLRQDKVIDKFRQQNKRYREALEEIMRTETVTSLTRGQVAYTFGGHIARKALKGESE